jgi:hypothetical protein
VLPVPVVEIFAKKKSSSVIHGSFEFMSHNTEHNEHWHDAWRRAHTVCSVHAVTVATHLSVWLVASSPCSPQMPIEFTNYCQHSRTPAVQKSTAETVNLNHPICQAAAPILFLLRLKSEL